MLSPFHHTRCHLQSTLQKGDAQGDGEALRALDTSLADWMSKLKGSLCDRSVKELQRQRAKDIVATTFNKLGIVVPYDEKTDLGYRPLPMSDSK